MRHEQPRVDGDRLSHQELLTLAATLLMAGTDTTRNQLAAAVEVFCDHPDQRAHCWPNTAAANRDPEVYSNPDRFDITREDAPAMLTFGGGVHYCLGSHLARIELTEALTTMARRMPAIRRNGPARWKPITGISGPATLPIAFDSGH